MTDSPPVILASVAIAISVALLVWSVFEIGVTGMARYRASFTEKAQFRLRELFLFVDPSRLFALNISVLLISMVAVWFFTGSWVLCLIAAVVVALLPRFTLRYLRQKRLDTLEQQLPDALLMLASGMRSGASLTLAVQQLVQESRPPISQEFEMMLREQRLGVSLDNALDNINQRVPLQSVTLMVSAMRIAHETGGGLAESLERASQTLRSKIAMEGKIRALTAQGKMQAWVVGLLPVSLIFVLSKMEPEAMALLWTTQIGYATLAGIVVLEFLGISMIRKIVAIDV